MNDPVERWGIAPQVAYVDCGTEVVVLQLLDPESSRPHILTGPGQLVWRLLAETPSFQDLEVGLRESDASVQVEDDLRRFLDHLAELGFAARQHT